MLLPKRLPSRPDPVSVSDDAPITVFFPALDEEATVAGLIARLPSRVEGHPVRVVVVDDGSTDQTAQRAVAAGAEVVSFAENRGLGAAVRVGLRNGVTAASAATVFLDADEEYAPEELPRLVEPILSGRADYVAGSRFDGEIEHMRPQRRLGNRIITRCLSWVARRPISDGQSGYRALSLRAAAAAEVIHDYNYAQVLTLDLLAKGFVYREVPISYRFRTTGDSFVRLHLYLRECIPAVRAELRTSALVAPISSADLGPRTTPAAPSIPESALTTPT